METKYVIDYEGFCPICEKPARFQSEHLWERDYLLCRSCDNTSIPRERAIALTINRYLPDWRNLKIHESSPNDSGVSRKLRLSCPGYIGSQYYKDAPGGTMVGVYRSENLEKLTFEDNSFDIFVSLDVFEHIFDPEAAIKEVWRTLKPGGYMFSTWPIRNYQVPAIERRAEMGPNGEVVHLKNPPEIHGNPVDGSGSLVTVDYGYDIHKLLAEWAPFDVCIQRFADRTHGILGEYTDLIICRKLAAS